MTPKEAIGKLAEIQIGYQFRSKPKADENGSVKLIQIKDILPGRNGIHSDSALRFEPERNPNKQLLQEGDVLFMGKGTAPFACRIMKLTGPTVAGGMFFILRPDTQRILPEYLSWVLNNKQTLEKLKIASGTGVAMPVIRRKELERLTIPLPPLENQQRIGEIQALKELEQNLMKDLTKQQQLLADGICKKLMEGKTDE
ncbi:restriction endonuclease subunit S [Verrucomicrobia bacterium S94]|nr:restriction endonuclease subunit S [Verrucomicrobia bacterium S94]